MKKQTSHKKTALKKPAMKKAPPPRKPSSSRPKRKAQGESELTQIVARLAMITENLAQTTERLAGVAAGWSRPEEPHGDLEKHMLRQEAGTDHHEPATEEPPDFMADSIPSEDGADDESKE